MTDPFVDLLAQCRELKSLRASMAVLEWDQNVGMPSNGAASRGEALALLARIFHERLVDPRLTELVETVDTSTPARAAAVRELRRTIGRAVKVSGDLVAEERRATTAAFHAWLEAKARSRFDHLAPALHRVLAIKREAAAAIDASRPAYDVLLEDFEPTATSADLRVMFTRLAEGLRPLVEAARGGPHPHPIVGEHPLERQRALHEEIVAALGYDLQGGRLDLSEHPFSVGVDAGDVRITTHLYADDVLRGLGGTIHETGHALYEQGLPHDLPGTGVDEAASVGLHESQSRFWENLVGRSLPFFRWVAPRMEHHLGVPFDPEALYRAANPVQATPIRVFADEATYNLHIALRFELELALVSGDLPVADLPGAWSEASERLLGIRPADDGEGCLQDVHWPIGAIGYFPTYTLGNLWAASLGVALRRDLPDLWERIEVGDFAPILAWLRDRIHAHGHVLEAPEVVRAAAGERDGITDLLDHLWERHGALYGLRRP